jgi:hypothetical protein
VIFDFLPASSFEQGLIDENTGILNIRSVYDVDGIDIADPNIGAVADPAQTAADQRPRRFLRIEKAVSIPDDDIVDLSARDFGPDIRQGMREIIGYAPIEPDGSVRVKVPATVALAVSVLDANARRVTGRHQSWLQVMPGQELRCTGCHAPFSDLSHGRSDSFASVYAGATGNGINFPNTLASVSPNLGETMAEARTRVHCQPLDCSVLEPTLDVVYDEFWEDADPPDFDDGFAYSYDVPELISVLPSMPVNKPACLSGWDPTCRIIINYETHIHPLWGADRGVNTCTNSGCRCSGPTSSRPFGSRSTTW